MSGFLMMLTQNGKLLYISDNAAEYLGHSMVSIKFNFTCLIFDSWNSIEKSGFARDLQTSQNKSESL